jgi:predicted metal-binding membrane protein
MTDSTLETVLRRDRIIVAGALVIIIALASGYVLWLATRSSPHRQTRVPSEPSNSRRNVSKSQHQAALEIGAMLWIALLALLVLLEKLTPFGLWIARAAGIACIAAGGWMLLFFRQ